ncbi:hypothetical protein FOG48_00693 [Hanseniaspora uvarum]|nr:hypothetical protein FOG48_00693 [Hanseniaspora uvarum]
MDQLIQQLNELLTKIVSGQSLKETTDILQKQIYNQPQCLGALVQLALTEGVDLSVKNLAAIELRKQVLLHWEQIDANTGSQIKALLVENLFKIKEKNIRHSIARVVGEITALELEKSNNTDFLSQIFQAAASPDSAVRETAMYVIVTICEGFVPAILSSSSQLFDLLSLSLPESAENTLDTRCLAIQVFNLLGQIIEEQGQDVPADVYPKYQSLCSPVLLVLQTVIQQEDEAKAQELFSCLNELLVLNNKLVGNEIVNVIRACLQVAGNTGIDEEIRCHSLRFLTSAVSYKKSKIIQSQLGGEFTVVALKVASEEVDVEEELSNEDEANENEENTPSQLATRLLYFICSELPPQQTAALILSSIPDMLNSGNVFAQRAVFTSIEVAVAGSPDYVLTNLDSKIIGNVLEGLKNPQPVVQLAALKALSSLTSELQDEVTKYYESFISLIIQIIDNAQSVVIYRHATKALDGFLEFMNLEDISKFMEPLMEKLFSMLEHNQSSKLRCEIVSAIGSAAFASGSAFVPYFNKSVEYLKNFIQKLDSLEGLSEDDIELRALTFENISTIGRAVKAEVFKPYAADFVNAAYEAISGDNSRIREAGYAFVGNVAKVYGTQFSSYLELLMPEILKTLQQVEYDIDTDGMNLEALDTDEIASKFQVNTGITFEKEVATAALSELVVATKEAFMPYVEQTLAVLVSEVENTYGLKEAFITSIWAVISGVINTAVPTLKNNAPKGLPQESYIPANILAFVETARETTLSSLPDEYEISIVISMLENITEALNNYGSIILSSGNGDHASLDLLCSQLVELLQGKHLCQSLDEDFGDDEDAGLADLDASESDGLLTNVVLETLTALSKALSVSEFSNIFTSLQNQIVSLMSSGSRAKRASVIGTVAEICMNLGPENPFLSVLLEHFINKLSTDKSLEVRGYAAYGVGILIKNAVNVDVTPAYQPILKSLFEVMSVSNEKKPDENTTQEVIDRCIANCCGCLARMILHNETLVPLSATIPPLLKQLPLKAGYEEYEPIFEVLLNLYSKNDPVILESSDLVAAALNNVFSLDAERSKLSENTTIGRDLSVEKLKQFTSDEMRAKVVSLVHFLKQKYPQLIAAHPALSSL